MAMAFLQWWSMRMGRVFSPMFTSHAFRNAVVEAIEELPDRERLVMALYYDEELTLKEVGAVLDLSESRVCQIHGQALVRLRARLGEWVDD